MVTFCIASKAPEPQAHVVGLGDIGISPAAFELEVRPLVAVPDIAMPISGFEDADYFFYASRGQIFRQTWTWIGLYRPSIDPNGRGGSYAAAGILLLNQSGPGQAVMHMLTALDELLRSCVLSGGRLRPDWREVVATDRVVQVSDWLDTLVQPLAAGVGIVPENTAVAYLKGDDETPETLARLIDAIQKGGGLGSYGRIFFGPSPSLSNKLGSRAELPTLRLTPGASQAQSVRMPAPDPDAPRAMALVAQTAPASALRALSEPPTVELRDVMSTLKFLSEDMRKLKDDIDDGHRDFVSFRRIAGIVFAAALFASAAVGTAAFYGLASYWTDAISTRNGDVNGLQDVVAKMRREMGTLSNLVRQAISHATPGRHTGASVPPPPAPVRRGSSSTVPAKPVKPLKKPIPPHSDSHAEKPGGKGQGDGKPADSAPLPAPAGGTVPAADTH